MSIQNNEGKKKEGTLLGGLGVIGILLFKFKAALFAIFKFGWLAKSFLSIILTIGIYSMFFGWPYAVAVVLLILIHEGGHFIWMQALGLGPKAPIFIPGVGAFTAMNNLPPDAVTRAWVAFAGPLVGGVCSAAMYWGGGQLNNGWLMAAGSFGFMLNLLQLIPAKPLDGGFVVLAISRWLLLPGSILLCAVALMFHSILFGIIGVFSLFKAVKQLFGRDTVEDNVVPATIPQRFVIGVAYLALAGMLGYLFTLSQTTVMDVVKRDPRGRQAIQQMAPAQHHKARSGGSEQSSDSDDSDQSDQAFDQQSDERSHKQSDERSDK
jgi:hypothetical protein